MASLEGKDFSLSVDTEGNISEIRRGERTFRPPMGYTLYRVDGQLCEVTQASGEAAYRLQTAEFSGTLTFNAGDEIRISYAPEKDEKPQQLSLILPVPGQSVFHLPEAHNIGRMIEGDMPAGEQYTSRLGYNFALINAAGLWIRLRAVEPNDYQRQRAANLHISRHPNEFIASFNWKSSDELLISAFDSLEEAVLDYQGWLEEKLGFKKLRDKPSVPSWVHNTKLVLILDMLRSNWEITHDYDDIANLAKDLKKNGCPQDTLFYLPGWNGAYDSTYPNYKPHPDLGGEEKFRRMVQTVHECGFRILIHTNPWGLDPCHPDIDRYLPYAVKDRNGDYAGFQTASFTKWGQAAPPNRPLNFQTKKVAIGASGSSFSIESVYVPDSCEALLTVGGVKIGRERLRVTIDRRSYLTPPGWFAKEQEYTIPFPFLLKPGPNTIRFDVQGEQADFGEGWYRIHRCYISQTPYSSWTYPILFGDTKQPEWVRIFVDAIASAVHDYGIDALHFDATEYQSNREVYEEVVKALPDTVKCGEGFNTLSAMNFWTFAQSGRCQSLLGYLDEIRGSHQQGSLMDDSDIETHLSWLNKPSAVNDFVRDYIKVYPHLCAADSFVPLGKVCNTYPPRLSPRNKERLWKVIRDGKRLNFTPALRLNYREYGLDADTAQAIREATG
jgi:hypothetical protein